MAEISPPTTRPFPSDPAFVRTAGIDDKGTTKLFPEACPPTPPDPPPPDVTNPVVGNFVPENGSTLLPTQSISFTVTDNSSQLRKIFVCAIFSGGEVDTVYDGDRFSPRYIATSTKTDVTDGFSFSVRPLLGWTNSPTIRVYALDYAGNEN